MDIKFDNRALFITCLALVFAAGIGLRIVFIGSSTFKGADEGYYVMYAKYMAQEKGASLQALSDEYIRNKERQLFPNPLRAGYILLSAASMKALKLYDFKAIAYLSLFFSILSLFIGYVFIRKMFGEHIALLSLILFAVSPLNLALARRALQDGVVYFFMILTLYLFYEVLTNGGIMRNVLFALSFFITIMVKESSIIMALFFSIYIFWQRAFIDKKFRPALTLFGLVAVIFGSLAVYVWVTGSPANLRAMANIILTSPANNAYAIKYQTGSALRYLLDFLLLSPATLLAAAGFLVIYAARQDLQKASYTYLVFFFIFFYAGYSFFSKNIRYVMALDLPIRVFAAMFIYEAAGKFFKNNARPAALTCIAIMAVMDLFVFLYLFIDKEVYDPVTFTLINAWQT